ncbi:TIGR02444 family protein [Mycobacterium sp. NPDC006124]|uniref:TIGR02444 family protein n=1 Tax=Mycobacterium sp. NPDC006124 TaxID=3156729 RepID=UPI0033B0EC64
MIDTHEDFRGFAVGVHGAPGVAEACVLLQDRRNLDVNILLLAAFVATVRGSTLTESDVAHARARVRSWRDDVVVPLRTVRRRLKDGPPPAPNASTAALRAQVKTVELDAEMIELDELSTVVARLEAPTVSGTAGHRATAAMTVVVGAALDDEERDAIAVIASAAARFVEDLM